MLPATHPLDERQRVEALHSLGLLDTPAEERFDRIVRIAARLFAVPVAAIGLVDSTREWFKSALGFGIPQLAREISLGSHVLVADGPLIVSDLRVDPRFHDHPLASGSPAIRFYAGIQLAAKDGSAIGVLSLFDAQPREGSTIDPVALRDIASLAERELHATESSPILVGLQGERDRIDPLTRLWNRGAVTTLLKTELAHASKHGKPIGLLLADVDRLGIINADLGTEAGNAVLCDVAHRLRLSLRPYDTVGRYGGEQFMVVLPSTAAAGAYGTGERIRSAFASAQTGTVTISIGAAAAEQEGEFDFERLLSAAQGALVRAKASGGNRVQLAELIRTPTLDRGDDHAPV